MSTFRRPNRLLVPPQRQALALSAACSFLLLAAIPLLAAEEAFLAAARTIDAREPALIELRRDLHRHPEISGQEERTSRVVAERLRKLGLEVRTGVGGHGVVALLRGAKPGGTVAFRADMDAVRSQAPDPVDFRSQRPGVRHICGHDLHTTIGVAIAEGLAASESEWRGNVLFVFQPAEENATGARAMLADNVLGTQPPSAIFAYHTAPLQSGQVATASRTLMASRDLVTVKLSGRGDLAAAADAARRILLSTSTLSAQQSFAPATDLEFVLAYSGAPAVSSQEASVTATLTLASDAARARVRDSIEQQLDALRSETLQVESTYQAKWIAGVTNDQDLAASASTSAAKVLGADSVLQLQSVVPAFSEDFGSFQEQVPGVMFFLGVANQEKGYSGMPHSPDYVADEAAIALGAKAMVKILLDQLERE